MKQFKFCHWNFTALEYKGAETFLNRMAGKGWALCRVDDRSAAASFRRTQEPPVYCVDLFDHCSQSEIDEYVGLCESSGWRLSCVSRKRMYIYQSEPGKQPVSLQTDDRLELENLRENGGAGGILFLHALTSVLWIVFIKVLLLDLFVAGYEPSMLAWYVCMTALMVCLSLYSLYKLCFYLFFTHRCKAEMRESGQMYRIAADRLEKLRRFNAAVDMGLFAAAYLILFWFYGMYLLLAREWPGAQEAALYGVNLAIGILFLCSAIFWAVGSAGCLTAAEGTGRPFWWLRIVGWFLFYIGCFNIVSVLRSWEWYLRWAAEWLH